MMQSFLLQLMRMSLSGAAAALVVLLARLVLKKAPRAVVCVLWVVVFFRLACPFTIESAVGFFPAQSQWTAPQSTVVSAPAQNHSNDETHPLPVQAAPILQEPSAERIEVEKPITTQRDWQPVIWTAGAVVWAMGAAVMLLHGVISLIRLQRSLRSAVKQDRRVYCVKGLPTAFVLGVLRPRIYLPAELEARERGYILLHEQMHIRRGDPAFKLLTYFVLCLHWFNPVVWLAFMLCGRDMEMACDEAVIRRLGVGVKKEYSASLLQLATGRRIVTGMPLAFGEGDTRGRIRNVLRYKKPAFWAAAVAVIVVAGLCIGLACSRPQKTALLRVGWEIYEMDGEAARTVPAGSISFGALKGVEDGSMPLQDRQAVRLNAQYVGCELYGNGSDCIYLEKTDGSALVFRLAQQQEAPVLDVETPQIQTVLADRAQLFQLTNAQGSRSFAGFSVGDAGDVCVVCALPQQEGATVLGALRANGQALQQSGAALGRIWAQESEYEVLLVTEPSIARAVRTDATGINEWSPEGFPSFCVMAAGEDAQWAFYDAAGQQLDIRPLSLASETQGGSASTTVTETAQQDSVVRVEWVQDGKTTFERAFDADQQDALRSYLEGVWMNVQSRSAAWDVTKNMRAEDSIRVTLGSGVQMYLYEFPELNCAVAEFEGIWMTLSDEIWEMLNQAVLGETQPCIYTLTQGCVGVDLNSIVLRENAVGGAAQQLWDRCMAAALSENAEDLSEKEEYYTLTRKALDGSEQSVHLFQVGSGVMIQKDDAAGRAELPDGMEYSWLGSLFSSEKRLIADLDGDGRRDVVWWSERSRSGYGVTLYMALGNGKLHTRDVQAMMGHSLEAADVTGDGIPELIVMADTGGNGGAGCWVLEVLSFQSGVPESMSLPFFAERSEEEPDWSTSGYRFGTQFEDGFRLHIRSDKMDRVISFAEDEMQVQDRISIGQFDESGHVLYTYRFEDSGCDGICAYELVRDARGVSALCVYQYLYQQSHMDCVGFGMTVLRWNEDAQCFEAVSQGWVQEVPQSAWDQDMN